MFTLFGTIILLYEVIVALSTPHFPKYQVRICYISISYQFNNFNTIVIIFLDYFQIWIRTMIRQKPTRINVSSLSHFLKFTQISHFHHLNHPQTLLKSTFLSYHITIFSFLHFSSSTLIFYNPYKH